MICKFYGSVKNLLNYLIFYYTKEEEERLQKIQEARRERDKEKEKDKERDRDRDKDREKDRRDRYYF